MNRRQFINKTVSATAAGFLTLPNLVYVMIWVMEILAAMVQL